MTKHLTVGVRENAIISKAAIEFHPAYMWPQADIRLDFRPGGIAFDSGPFTDLPVVYGGERVPSAYGVAFITAVMRAAKVTSWDAVVGAEVIALRYQERGTVLGLAAVDGSYEFTVEQLVDEIDALEGKAPIGGF